MNIETVCYDLSFLNVEFQANFFTLLFHFHQAILIPLCASSSLSGSFAFSKSSLNNSKIFHILLKPGLENFDHYFASMWDECNCEIVWTFFSIASLWDWNENWSFPVCGHCWVFQICWHIECSTFTASSFSIWNSSAGIPSPPLALFVVMLPKVHLTLHSRMSGSR